MKKHVLPEGFLAAGMHCGLKKKRKDLSLIYSTRPCETAALFTRNKVKAAPVVLDQEILRKNGRTRAVIVNSGNANCMTGSRGMADAVRMGKAAAKELKVRSDEVLVSSTGVIGRPMRMQPLLKGLPRLVRELSPDGLADAADGIMTTDQFRKIASRKFISGGAEITITGIAKGAGMIHPDMATMLCYIMTDAAISSGALKKALRDAAGVSFNAITVDGDMSTNDTAMIMANGAAGNRTLSGAGKDYAIFLENLKAVSGELSRLIVADGEGASKVIEVTVRGARTSSDARKAAKAIAGSLLVKCAVLGADPNWGRIASSLGASGAAVDQEKLEVIMDGVTFFKNGVEAKMSGTRMRSVFKGTDVNITADLHLGRSAASVLTCDISNKYIRLNSYYTT
jgi:glutamate N-acetyltransferase / amino-acid N-acetyltransferase